MFYSPIEDINGLNSLIGSIVPPARITHALSSINCFKGYMMSRHNIYIEVSVEKVSEFFKIKLYLD